MRLTLPPSMMALSRSSFHAVFQCPPRGCRSSAAAIAAAIAGNDLMKAARALAEKGVVPPGVDPAHHRVRSAAVVLPPDQAFKDAAKEDLRVRSGVAQSSV